MHLRDHNHYRWPPDHLLANWFCKYLLPHISKDIGLSGVVTEDQCICRAQHLDLIYSQSGTLYDLLPNALGNPNPPATQKTRAHADGLVGTIYGVATKQFWSKPPSHPRLPLPLTKQLIFLPLS